MLRNQISCLKTQLSKMTKCYPTSKIDLQVPPRKSQSAMLRRGHSLTLELMGVTDIQFYISLEFQGPTGPKNSSSCGGLARFAHKKVRFAHILLLPIDIIITTNIFNIKCLSPPLSLKMFVPPGDKQNVTD